MPVRIVSALIDCLSMFLFVAFSAGLTWLLGA
jgi:hypothetical protein